MRQYPVYVLSAVGAVMSTVVISNVFGRYWWTLTPSVVQQWVDSPASNRGIIIAVSDTNSSSVFEWYSSEYTYNVQVRPSLEIVGSVIPEPGSFAMLAATGLLLLLRRIRA